MHRKLIVVGLIVALIAPAVLASASEEKPPAAKSEDSRPVISLKANMGGRNMEVEVEQTQEGVAVKGTMDDQTVTATGTRQEDGTLKVEVQKDKDTMLEMTIDPEAVRGMGSGAKP